MLPVLLSAAVAVPGTPAHAAENPHEPAALAGGRWLAAEIDNGEMSGGFGADWGLTIDTLLALQATGADAATAAAIADAVDERGSAYFTFDLGDGEQAWIGGATAKTLVAAVSAGRDPAAFTGRDLRQATLDLVAAEGPAKGQIQSKNTGNAGGNTFDQSLGVIGLARSGGVPEDVVDFLVRQQCPAGGFRLGGFGNGAPVCNEDSSIDPDATAMAVQALLEAGAAGIENAETVARRGARYLADTQGEDGSFGGAGPTAAANTNSTGLAGGALAAAGLGAEADRAADWVREHQVAAANAGKATGEIGAIAYNQQAFTEATAEAVDGRFLAGRDQWRRAGAQAVLALAKVPLGRTGADAGPNPDPDPEPEPDPGQGTPRPQPEPPAPAPGPPGVGGAGPAADPAHAGNRGSGDGDAANAAAPEGAGRRGAALASTGFPVFESLYGAGSLLAAGLVLTLLARRRTESR